MSFDPSHIISALVSAAIGLAIGGAAFFVRATSDTKVAGAMVAVTAEFKAFGKDVMEKMDGLKEALHGVANANSVAAERHASLSEKHEKLESRVSLIEEDFYKPRQARGAAKGANE